MQGERERRNRALSLLDSLSLQEEAGKLVVRLGEARMHELPTRPGVCKSRDIYVDEQRTIAAKIEHSLSPHTREPYQCWNEYVLWDEELHESPVAQEWVAPTLELNIYPCPMHRECVVSVCIQEYVDDGWPNKQPYRRAEVGELNELFDAHPLLVADVSYKLHHQTVYSMKRGHVVLVDYGYQSASGIRVPSRRRPDGFWAWVRRAISRTSDDGSYSL